MEHISGQVVLITGGCGVIGLAMVKELLNHGARGVAIVDISQAHGQKVLKELTDSFGSSKVIFIKADITNKEEFEAAFEATIKTYNQLDIVINNAGIVNEIEWRKTIAVNFIALTEGNYLAMTKYLPRYKSGQEGIIVNIASELGFSKQDTMPVYSATKHAVVGLGLALGSEEFYKEYKVRILTICPGPVNTPLITANHEERYWFPQIMKQKLLEELKEFIQTPENVARAIPDVIRKGKNGSLWLVIKNEAAYEVKIPPVESMKVSVTDNN